MKLTFMYRVFTPIIFCIFTTTSYALDDVEVVKPTTDFSKPERFESLPAGALTHKKKINNNAFSNASANMSFERELDFKIGNAFFRKLWVSSPASTTSSDGLGPIFNARACQRCHIKDGRGHAPASNDDNAVSMLMRLSIKPQNAEQQALIDSHRALSIPDPVYGGQLQDFSVANARAEGRINIEYTEHTITLNGGKQISLRKPHYSITNLQYGELHDDIMLSPRVAPQVIGLGLLEAIASVEIEKQADPNDENGDGISGRANKVWSHEYRQVMLGRFGLKAGQPTVNQQNQAAFGGDMGLSTPLFSNAYGDCTSAQSDCLDKPHGGHPEVSEQIAQQVLHYSRNLAVPARRNVSDGNVLKGKELFYQSGCINCHTPKYITPRDTEEPEQSRQLIWPYTDLLLHDMGEGLADHAPEGIANGREWRTSPLWGIGLTPVVNDHSQYLHDGRARNLLEAILWHGGEAETSQQKVIEMTDQQRDQLIKFVESL